MIPPQRLIISEIMGGLRDYEEPFFINNDTFSTLQNALCWRKRVMKKPGSQLLGQLQRNIGTTGASPFTATISPTPLVHGVSSFQIGSVVLIDGDTTGGAIATLTSSNVSYSGTLNRTTGALSITIPAIAPTAVQYFPGLPCLGIEDFESDKSPNTQIDFPTNVFFDQTYSYQYNGTAFFDVSFYKITAAPVFWTGQNYEQFFSCNYYRAMFVTNNNPGMQFKPITGMPVVGNTSQFTVTGHGLSTGDYVFINEVVGVTGVNGVSGAVTVIDPNTFSLSTPGAAGAWSSGGIAQYMTRLVPGNGDGIRWYDGFAPGVLGWVNFAPPLDNLQSSATTYLMGARIVLPFGNRLLAIGTFEGTSAQVATPVYYGNRIRYCEVSATPFYAQPVPATSTAGFNANAWASNIQGFGGFIDLDTTDRIISASVTQGNMILGLETEQRRMSNTGIETDPFSLQVINPEYGTAGTYATVPMDKGILSFGEYGILETSSYDAHRIDLPIIDQVFQAQQNNNGYERICGGRDFVHEVVYFTYYSDQNTSNMFPDTTIVLNYRENSWAIWQESFTTYGLYKNSTGDVWQTYFIPWEDWTTNWEDLGTDRYLNPFVAGGTPQGFVMLKWSDLSFNQPSLFINAITLNGDGTATITSTNHNLQEGTFLGFWSGPPASGTDIQAFNGQASVIDANMIKISFGPGAVPGNIVPGIWLMSVVDQIDIYTKQFQLGWSANQKTRIGSQKYFLDTTTEGEFTVNIYGSQSDISLDNPNTSSSLISSNVVRTRPDNSLGLNDNAQSQAQIWHRLASSAIGDTVQLEYTFSTMQMFNVDISTSPWVMYSTVLDLYPSRMLA